MFPSTAPINQNITVTERVRVAALSMLTAMASFQIKKGWNERLRLNNLDTLEALLAWPMEDSTANSSDTIISGTVTLADGEMLQLKRTGRPSFISACRSLWRWRCRHCEPVWEARLFDLLLTLGFNVPTCIAQGENRLIGFTPVGAVLYQLPPGTSLDVFLRETPDESERREAILQAENTLRALQFHQIAWDDCHPRHFQTLPGGTGIGLTCLEKAQVQDTPLNDAACQRQFEYFYANL